MSNRFDGVRCLVTGGADGIGRATVQLLAGEGARVLAVDRAAEGLDSLEGVSTLVADVTAADAPDVIMSAADEQLGGLDVLINNAGVSLGAPLESLSDELFEDVLAVNLRAVFRLSRAAIPRLKVSKCGRIVNIGSVMSERAAPGMAAYTVSKHGVAGLTKSLALELGEYGVTANYVMPGAIVTGITRDVFAADPQFREFWEQKAALKRLGQPEDIARAISFLVSEDAAFVTGHGLLVDGGALQSP